MTTTLRPFDITRQRPLSRSSPNTIFTTYLLTLP